MTNEELVERVIQQSDRKDFAAAWDAARKLADRLAAEGTKLTTTPEQHVKILRAFPRLLGPFLVMEDHR